MSIEQQIRGWADAVHRGDLDAVLVQHAHDIVMFDVPTPHRGVRGISAYRDTWPGFMSWQASGGSFEIDEIAVTEGEDVAFVWALLRCDSAEALAAQPDRRLRLTVGLRREAGQWVVAHEHHSFADSSDDPS